MSIKDSRVVVAVVAQRSINCKIAVAMLWKGSAILIINNGDTLPPIWAPHTLLLIASPAPYSVSQSQLPGEQRGFAVESLMTRVHVVTQAPLPPSANASPIQ